MLFVVGSAPRHSSSYSLFKGVSRTCVLRGRCSFPRGSLVARRGHRSGKKGRFFLGLPLEFGTTYELPFLLLKEWLKLTGRL